MDAASTRELDRMEALRRLEITRGLGIAARERRKAIRRERMRWAVSEGRHDQFASSSRRQVASFSPLGLRSGLSQACVGVPPDGFIEGRGCRCMSLMCLQAI